VSYPATITEIAPLATVSSGVVNYQVTAQLTDSDKVSTLKSGLSATVNVIIAQKNNVLIVPTRAITHTGQNATVQVVNGTVTEARTIQTGISDSSNTEVTSGLTAGEVILTRSSSNKTSTTTNQGGPGGMIPGIGGMP
jgi:multidrug efflux pump subunit AcrA (membrane-fusion protein)